MLHNLTADGSGTLSSDFVRSVLVGDVVFALVVGVIVGVVLKISVVVVVVSVVVAAVVVVVDCDMGSAFPTNPTIS